MNFKGTLSIGFLVCTSSLAAASGVNDIGSFIDNPRLYNDFSSSNLSYSSNYNASGSSLSIQESSYGSGNFANRHSAFFGDMVGTNKVELAYGDNWDMQMNLQINQATDVGNVEAGFQFDLFGLGQFGVQSGNGEIAAFGGVVPFYSFGSGLYNVGDELSLRMIHTSGDGEGIGAPSSLEYMYNNMTTGSGWVSSGAIAFDNLEGGIPSSAGDLFMAIGAQINNPNAISGAVDINFTNLTMTVPTPGSLALLSLAGIGVSRRRR